MADLTRAQVRILIQEAEGLISLAEQAEVKLEAMRLQAQSAAEGAVSARVEDMLIEVRVRLIPNMGVWVSEPYGKRTLLEVSQMPNAVAVDKRGRRHVAAEAAAALRARIRVPLEADRKCGGQAVQAVCSATAYVQVMQEADGLADAADALCIRLRKLIGDAQAQASGIRRVFSSRQAAERGREACQGIEDALNSDTARRIRNLAFDAEELAPMPLDDAAKALEDPAFAAKVMEAFPGTFQPGPWAMSSSDAAAHIDRLAALSRAAHSALKPPSAVVEGVQSAVDRMFGPEALAEAGARPVSDLNKVTKGIRVSMLARAGYETVEDVYRASALQLSQIKGISPSGAAEAKNAAKSLVRSSMVGKPLRISADDKTPEATNIVRAAAAMVRAEDICAGLASEAELFANMASFGKDRLKPVADDPIGWVFADAERIEQADGAMESIERFYASSQVSHAARCLRELQSLAQDGVREDSAWIAYLADPVKAVGAVERAMPDVFGTGANGDLPEELIAEVEAQGLSTDGLKCTLRRYQELGAKYALRQGRVILGDEMGLGKTVQAIAVMVSLRNAGASHFLVVCPAAVLENWCREVSRHSDLVPVKVHGKSAGSDFAKWLGTGGVAVTSYETLRKLNLPEGFRYGLLVLDEAHYIKNKATNRSRGAVRLMKGTDRVLMMTGTALENRVDEMLVLIGMLRPEVACEARKHATLASALQFRREIAPVYYRRRKADVLSELPELIETEEWCSMGAAERKVYEEGVMARKIMSARRVSWSVADPARSCKAKRLLELADEAAEDGRKVLVFSFFLDTLRMVAHMLGERCVGTIDGSVPPAMRQQLVDAFEAAPAGSVLLGQVQAAGTGMNIQSASVVVFCEPQFKPSIEHQAVARSYRMGQTRSVLAFRLLCEDSIDERILGILAAKQESFDAFADESEAAKADEAKITDGMVKRILDEEIERIEARNAGLDAGEPPETPDQTDEKQEKQQRKLPELDIEGALALRCGVSVTKRIKQVSQPYGGYLKPSSLKVEPLGEGIDALEQGEGLNAALVGMAVDYLARFKSGSTVEQAFSISRMGAEKVGEEELFDSLLSEVSGLDDRSIKAAAKLVGFDGAYRSGQYTPVQEIEADAVSIRNIRTMVERTLKFLDVYGPKTMDGFTLDGGYTPTVSKGDGDFLTADGLWDLKVSKHKPTKDHTLQLLMYWRMGMHSIHSEFKAVKRLGIYNPRRNEVYTVEVSVIPQELIDQVERDVIGY